MPKIENHQSEIVPMLTGIHLFHFDAAPCAQRVRFVLAEKGLRRGPDVRFDDVSSETCHAARGTWNSRIVSLIKKEHFSPTYAAIQPNLVIPALVHDGNLFIESMDIIQYLDETLGGDRLAPTSDDPRYEDIHFLTDLGKRLHQSIRYVSYRWSAGRLGKISGKEQANIQNLLSNSDDQENLVEFYRKFSADEISEETYRDHLRALANGFMELENRLQDGRDFLTGNSLSMADAIWSMKVVRLEEMGYPTAELFPAVGQWFARIANRPSHQEVMQSYQSIRTIFRTKAWIEKQLGVGLIKAVKELSYA